MKRLKLLILVFCVAISLPLAHVVRQSFQGLAEEERAQLRFFSQALFDEMEKKLAEWVQQEENRAVDEYHHTLSDGRGGCLSPLTRAPREAYILGYFQNNPDGSFQTPLMADPGQIPEEKREVVTQLEAANSFFNRKKLTLVATPPAPEPKKDTADAPKMEAEKKEKDGFADRYLARPQEQATKSNLGQKTKRTEEITVGQALKLSREDPSILGSGAAQDKGQPPVLAKAGEKKSSVDTLESKIYEIRSSPARQLKEDASAPAVAGALSDLKRFEVEVAPLQSISIGDGQFFIFRRVAINNQIFRQGFVLKARLFLSHLAATHFETQPMARFTGLSLQVMDNGQKTEMVSAGAPVSAAGFMTQRTFPAPFDFLSAAVWADALPASPARRTLSLALTVLGIFMLLGLFAIYQSVRTVVDLSERRSQFVSSVTHELKTPLTNIRMYIEMLEQGIAATPEREQDYFHILGSESVRLSRLINNVLELAKLEKKQRRFDLQPGDLQDVLSEVRTVMAHKLAQEGFSLKTDVPEDLRFSYDREVMIQVLINLIENSIKFGRSSPDRTIAIVVSLRDSRVHIAVSDTGPGIPGKALKRVFDDFYRVDNALTRATGGTGIGLALVKKFILAMEGQVRAANNPGPGCTITLSLPAIRRNVGVA
ncbi:MAG: ATP-binding protein [Pseudomonadota bacterium]